jgi:Flp pilus assembly protein CpaB
MTQFNAPSNQDTGNARLVLVALGLALLAVVLTNLYIEYVRRQVDEKSITVYLLTRTVQPGDRISRQDVDARRFPASFKEGFDAMGAMDDPGLDIRINGREPFRRSASQGELLTYRLFEAPAEREVDKRVARGKRAYSLPVNARTAPGGLREGMYVDIEAPFHIGGAVVVLPIMERMQVFALGTRTAFDDPDVGGRFNVNYRNITIQVEPQEATQLSMIERLAAGEFELHLRNPADMDAPKIPGGGINPRVIELLDRLVVDRHAPGLGSELGLR